MKDGASAVNPLVEDRRQRRASLVLRDVSYVNEAHFKFTGTEDRKPVKPQKVFERRASKGPCFQQGCWGVSGRP